MGQLCLLAPMVMLMLITTASQAQQMTWSAEARLVPQAGSKVPCPETTRQYQTPGMLSVRTPRGETKTGPVEPDGSVSMSWSSPIGVAQLVGQTKSKTMRLSPECPARLRMGPRGSGARRGARLNHLEHHHTAGMGQHPDLLAWRPR